MRSRAVALSILAHAALLGVIGWRSFRGEAPAPRLEIQAPLGDVFVKEQPGESAAPAAHAGPIGEEPSEVHAPAETSSGGPPRPPGVPLGEAHPVGEIRPNYPAMSRKLGEEGEAAFRLRINAAGAVEEALLEKSSGHPRLDEAAKAALLAARFRAESENGATAVRRFRVEFKLSGR